SLRKQRISLKKQKKRESFTEFCNRVTLSSVFIASFAFVLQMHRAAPIPLSYLSDKDITHLMQPFLYFFCHIFVILRSYIMKRSPSPPKFS
ncbi:MAG: hypothetical protein J6L87_05575, partial [Clostridia bacterium]|nr:hypothetical protein [Clostridia bacterium]